MLEAFKTQVKSIIYIFDCLKTDSSGAKCPTNQGTSGFRVHPAHHPGWGGPHPGPLDPGQNGTEDRGGKWPQFNYY
jgi:hypothetical protein